VQVVRDGAHSIGYVLLTFRGHEEDGQYVSACEELGVASCGDTIEAAFDALEEAVALYLDVLEEDGERERVFAERGITIRPGEPPPPGEAEPVSVRLREYVSRRLVSVPAAA
jgi:predicted RNase H-like HicB family nuclease